MHRERGLVRKGEVNYKGKLDLKVGNVTFNLMIPSSGMEYSVLLYLEVSGPKPHFTDTEFRSSFTGRSSFWKFFRN
jgi:hypothetical protein